MATEPMRYAWLGLAWALALPVQAEESTAAKPAIVVGAATDAILARQVQGESAGVLQPVSGEVATRSYKRYLDSFNKPMPEFKEAIGSVGQSGGGAP